MSDSGKPVTLESYVWLCAKIFCGVLLASALMIWISFLPHYSWAAKVGLILSVATVNAFLVAAFLMHLLSEKKLVYTVLIFTVIFVIGLFGLTLWAMSDFPIGTATH